MIYEIYPVFSYRARYSFALLASVLATIVTGCSSGPAPTAVPLESLNLRADSCEMLSKPPRSPVVYRCPTQGSPVFVTTVKDCSISEKLTFQTTTRQLFVGVVGMQVVSQAPVSLGSTHALQTVVTGTIDAEPVMMSSFTFRDEGCIDDIIIWQATKSPQTPPEQVEGFKTASQRLAKTLFNEELTVNDATNTPS
ncbi:MAG: hypothetical protein ACK5Y6_05835 [Pseudomonadota bacterium]